MKYLPSKHEKKNLVHINDIERAGISLQFSASGIRRTAIK